MKPKVFLRELDNKMAMVSADWLEEEIASNRDVVIIDLRGANKVNEQRITGSIQCNIQELPDKLPSLVSSKKNCIVMVCNGSIQSAMAVMYLRCEGYANSYNLSGGFSSWLRNGRKIVGSLR